MMSLDKITSQWKNMELTLMEDEVADFSHLKVSKGKETLALCIVGKLCLSKMVNIEAFRLVMKSNGKFIRVR